MQKIQNVKNAVFLNTTAVFIYFFVQWVLTVIVTRLLNYTSAGVFTLAVSFTNIFCYISNFGVRNIQISDSERKLDRNKYISSRILTSFISLLVFAVTIIVTKYDIQTTKCCIAMMLYKILESYSDILFGEMQVENRYDWIAASYILKSVFVLVFFLISVLIGFPLHICIYSMCIGYALSLFTFDLEKLGVYKTYHWDLETVLDLLKRSFPLTVMSILDAFLLFLPKHFVETICGSELLGYYGTVTIVIVVLSTLGSAVWGSLLPIYGKIFSEKRINEFKKMTKVILFLLLLAGVFLLTVGKMIAPFFYRIIFGNEIMKHMYLLTSVIINSLLLLYNSFFVCILVPLKNNRVLAISDVAAICILIPLCYLMTNKYQLLGASYSLSIALLVKFAILLINSILCVSSYFKKV